MLEGPDRAQSFFFAMVELHNQNVSIGCLNTSILTGFVHSQGEQKDILLQIILLGFITISLY